MIRYIIRITESEYEGINGVPLLGLKDKLIEGYVLGCTVGSPEWKCEGIMVENPDGNFFITESNSEWIKEGNLFGLKDTIIDGDVLWGTVGSTELKYEDIRVDSPDGNSKTFLVGKFDGEPLGLIDNKMLGIPDYSKLGKENGFVI